MDRRTLLVRALGAAQAVLGMVVALPGLRMLLAPLRRARRATGFIRVAPLPNETGKPIRVTVSADRWDGYMHYPPGPIGAVWLITEPATDGSTGVRCLQTVCPHLGCGINYVADRGAFTCPCHTSDFDARGKRLFGPSPRDMDELECRISEQDETGRRWVEVRYQEFRTGTSQRVPVV